MRFEYLEVWKRAARLSADMLSGIIKTKRGFLKKQMKFKNICINFKKRYL